jgi:hypothetical protein
MTVQRPSEFTEFRDGLVPTSETRLGNFAEAAVVIAALGWRGRSQCDMSVMECIIVLRKAMCRPAAEIYLGD